MQSRIKIAKINNNATEMPLGNNNTILYLLNLNIIQKYNDINIDL